MPLGDQRSVIVFGMARTPEKFASVALAAGLLLASCGSDGDTVDAAKGTVVGDAATSTETVAAPETTVAVEETTTTVAETTTTVEETTTTAAVVAGPADGVAFTNPAGEYSMLISPDWTDASAEFPPGVSGWFTGPVTAEFAENINILTDAIPNATPLTAILDASATQIEAQFESFNLINSEVQSRPGQTDVGVLEYTAEQEGVEIRFLQVFGVWNDTLVVFTASTSAATGEEAVERLRPYALTLAPPT